MTKVADRAEDEFTEMGIKIDRMTLVMDLLNADDMGMNWERLHEAPRVEFMHDICGIVTNMNRRTGVVENCFVPRFATNR
jgi:hypothetical protein